MYYVEKDFAFEHDGTELTGCMKASISIIKTFDEFGCLKLTQNREGRINPTFFGNSGCAVDLRVVLDPGGRLYYLIKVVYSTH